MTIPLLLMATACAAVTPESDRVLAGDLAPVAAMFGELAPDTPIALAPVAGARRILHPAELQLMAARFGLVSSIPPSHDICVERKLAPLLPADLLEAMKAALPAARLELLEFSSQPAPAGSLEFSPKDLRQTTAGAIWRGAVRYAGGRRFRIWAKVRVVVKEVRITAAESLRAGQTLLPANLRLEEVETFPEPGTFVSSLDNAAGRALRRPVEKGAALRTEWLEPARDVVRGEPVLVEAHAGAARLAFEGIAESHGAVGQKIPIRNPQSKKRFFARVAAKGKVVVEGVL